MNVSTKSSQTLDAAKDFQFEALKVLGIDASAVGNPSSDSGGRYSVPVRLSRSLDYREAAVIIGLWDGPEGSPPTHDSTTARIAADQFILVATTIDDVASHFAHALRLVVDRFNVEMPRRLRQQAENAARAAAAVAEHRDHIEEVSRTVRFE